MNDDSKTSENDELDLDPLTRAQIKSWLGANKFLDEKGKERATATAARVIAFVGSGASAALEVKKERNLTSHLEYLVEQTQGRDSKTLAVVAYNDESTCAQFDLDKGGLSEGQAKVLLKEIISERAEERKDKRELRKVIIAALLGFAAGALTRLIG